MTLRTMQYDVVIAGASVGGCATAALFARKGLRVAANMALGAYEVFQATATLPEPDWPEMGFDALVKTAFKDRYVRALNHPVIRRLRGER